MGVYKLVPLSDLARTYDGGNGRPDLELWTQKPVPVGRGVLSKSGYRFPAEWAQISSNHCTLTYVPGDQEGAGVWHVKDTSTNGTFINGVLIGKGNTSTLKVQDKISLSFLGSNAKEGAAALLQPGLEYELVYDAEAFPAAPRAGSVPPSLSSKRKQAEDGTPSAATKKARADAECNELLHLRQANQDLRRQNDTYRGLIADHEQRHQQEEALRHQQQEAAAQQLAELKQQAEDEKAELQASAKAQVDDLQHQLHDQAAELKAVQAALAEKSSLASGLQSQLDAYQQRVEQLQQNLEQTQQQLKQQEAAGQQAAQEAQELLNQLHDATAAAAAAARQVEEATAAAREAVARAEAAVGTKKVAEAEAKENGRQLAAALRQVAALQERLDSKREHLMLQSKQLMEVHADIVEVQRQQAERGTLLAELLARAQALEAEGNRNTSELLGGLSAQLVAIQEGAAAEAVQEEEHGGTDGFRVPRAPPAAAAAGDVDGDADVEMTQLASSQGTIPASLPMQQRPDEHQQHQQQQDQQEEEHQTTEGSPAATATASGGTLQAPGGTALLGGTGPATLDLGLGYMHGTHGGSAQKGATSKPSLGRQGHEGSFPGSLFPGPLTVPLVLPSDGGTGDRGATGGGGGGRRLSLPLQHLPGGGAASQTLSPQHSPVGGADAAAMEQNGGLGRDVGAAADGAGVVAGSHGDSGGFGDGGDAGFTEAGHNGGAAGAGEDGRETAAGGGGGGVDRRGNEDHDEDEGEEEEDEEMEEEEEEGADGRKPTEQEDMMPQVVNETEQDEFPECALHTQDSARAKGHRGAAAAAVPGEDQHATDLLMGLTEQAVQALHGENEGLGRGPAAAAGRGGGAVFGGSSGRNRTPLKVVSQQEVEGNVQGLWGHEDGKGEAEDGVAKSHAFQQQHQEQDHIGGPFGWGRG